MQKSTKNVLNFSLANTHHTGTFSVQYFVIIIANIIQQSILTCILQWHNSSQYKQNKKVNTHSLDASLTRYIHKYLIFHAFMLFLSLSRQSVSIIFYGRRFIRLSNNYWTMVYMEYE